MKPVIIFLASFLGTICAILVVDYLSLFWDKPIIFSFLFGVIVLSVLVTLISKTKDEK